jgi:MFS superfamily sulfate permease-like transporter
MTLPGLAIYRFGAPLFYANAGRFTEEIRAVVGSAPSPVRWLVVDAEAITNIDYTAARMLRDLHQGLSAADVMLAFARVSAFLQADFDRHHITEIIGAEMIFLHLHDAVNAFLKFEKESGDTSVREDIGPRQLPH